MLTDIIASAKKWLFFQINVSSSTRIEHLSKQSPHSSQSWIAMWKFNIQGLEVEKGTRRVLSYILVSARELFSPWLSQEQAPATPGAVVLPGDRWLHWPCTQRWCSQHVQGGPGPWTAWKKTASVQSGAAPQPPPCMYAHRTDSPPSSVEEQGIGPQSTSEGAQHQHLRKFLCGMHVDLC
jgi:hypothetical protein